MLVLSSIFNPLSSLVSAAHAAPSQEDVFRSIQDSVSGTNASGAGPAVLLFACGIGVLLLLAFLSRRGQRVAMKRSVNHAGKLVREIRKQIGLKPAEMKQLKLLSDGLATPDQPGPSPLTLLICPSVLSKALQVNSPKIDREVLAGLVKRMRSIEQV